MTKERKNKGQEKPMVQSRWSKIIGLYCQKLKVKIIQDELGDSAVVTHGKGLGSCPKTSLSTLGACTVLVILNHCERVDLSMRTLVGVGVGSACLSLSISTSLSHTHRRKKLFFKKNYISTDPIQAYKGVESLT